MGWTEDESWLDGRRCFIRADSNSGWNFDDLPDYLNDLNAMHEAEKTLHTDGGLWGAYCGYLVKDGSWFNTVHATASQRAEAFLKAINKLEQ